MKYVDLWQQRKKMPTDLQVTVVEYLTKTLKWKSCNDILQIGDSTSFRFRFLKGSESKAGANTNPFTMS